MIKEHECVVLTQELARQGFQPGDVGTVVHVHDDGAAFEGELMTLTGETIGVATILASQLRPASRRDLSHVREVEAA